VPPAVQDPCTNDVQPVGPGAADIQPTVVHATDQAQAARPTGVPMQHAEVNVTCEPLVGSPAALPVQPALPPAAGEAHVATGAASAAQPSGAQVVGEVNAGDHVAMRVQLSDAGPAAVLVQPAAAQPAGGTHATNPAAVLAQPAAQVAGEVHAASLASAPVQPTSVQVAGAAHAAGLAAPPVQLAPQVAGSAPCAGPLPEPRQQTAVQVADMSSATDVQPMVSEVVEAAHAASPPVIGEAQPADVGAVAVQHAAVQVMADAHAAASACSAAGGAPQCSVLTDGTAAPCMANSAIQGPPADGLQAAVPAMTTPQVAVQAVGLTRSEAPTSCSVPMEQSTGEQPSAEVVQGHGHVNLQGAPGAVVQGLAETQVPAGPLPAAVAAPSAAMPSECASDPLTGPSAPPAAASAPVQSALPGAVPESTAVQGTPGQASAVDAPLPASAAVGTPPTPPAAGAAGQAPFKYRTSICKYWRDKGFCRCGDSCNYAHGEAELRRARAAAGQPTSSADADPSAAGAASAASPRVILPPQLAQIDDMEHKMWQQQAAQAHVDGDPVDCMFGWHCKRVGCSLRHPQDGRSNGVQVQSGAQPFAEPENDFILHLDELPMPRRPQVLPSPVDREVFVDPFPFEGGSSNLREFLSSFGAIEEVFQLRGQDRGYVSFAAHEAAAACVAASTGAWSESERAVGAWPSRLAGAARAYPHSLVAYITGKDGARLQQIMDSTGVGGLRFWTGQQEASASWRVHFTGKATASQMQAVVPKLEELLAEAHCRMSEAIEARRPRSVLVRGIPTEWTRDAAESFFKPCGNIEEVILKGNGSVQLTFLSPGDAALVGEKLPGMVSSDASGRDMACEVVAPEAPAPEARAPEARAPAGQAPGAPSSEAPAGSSCCSVFIGNVPFGSSEEQLRQLFERAGPLTNVRFVLDKDTQKFKGFAFADFVHPDGAARAMQMLNDALFMGRKLRVGKAEAPHPRREPPRHPNGHSQRPGASQPWDSWASWERPHWDQTGAGSPSWWSSDRSAPGPYSAAELHQRRGMGADGPWGSWEQWGGPRGGKGAACDGPQAQTSLEHWTERPAEAPVLLGSASPQPSAAWQPGPPWQPGAAWPSQGFGPGGQQPGGSAWPNGHAAAEGRPSAEQAAWGQCGRGSCGDQVPWDSHGKGRGIDHGGPPFGKGKGDDLASWASCGKGKGADQAAWASYAKGKGGDQAAWASHCKGMGGDQTGWPSCGKGMGGDQAAWTGQSGSCQAGWARMWGGQDGGHCNEQAAWARPDANSGLWGGMRADSLSQQAQWANPDWGYRTEQAAWMCQGMNNAGDSSAWAGGKGEQGPCWPSPQPHHWMGAQMGCMGAAGPGAWSAESPAKRPRYM